MKVVYTAEVYEKAARWQELNTDGSNTPESWEEWEELDAWFEERLIDPELIDFTVTSDHREDN